MRPPPLQTVREELDAVMARIDETGLAALQGLFRDSARRIFFCGQGRSGLVAEMAAMRFMHLGYRVHFVGEATAPSIASGDLMIVLSASGETATTIAFARIARSVGAQVAGLMGRAESTLAQYCDPRILVPVAGSRQFGGTLFEQSCLLILDSIALAFSDGQHDAMQARHTNLQ
jgi:6-phospho-3-hexuloisomerase